MKVPQPNGKRGSLRWLQLLVELAPAMLADAIRSELSLPPEWDVNWKSPRRDDSWAEYRDGDFLDLIGLSRLKPELERFWPRRGPQLDALGVTNGGVVLLEAKAHIAEMTSSCQAESKAARDLIDASLAEARSGLGVRTPCDWSAPYYQYANRLAHLWFLRKHGVEPILAFVYFVGDKDIGGPDSKEGWLGPIGMARTHLGLTHPPLHTADIFIDVSKAPWWLSPAEIDLDAS